MNNRYRLALLAPVVAIVASGCVSVTSADHGSHMSQMPTVTASGSDASGSTARPMALMADAMFAQMMIPHHEQAIEMSQLAPGRTSNPAVLELAAKIENAQEPEIETMRTWLEDNGFPVMDADDMGGHMDHMSGMLSDEDIQRLRDSSGDEFDQLFLAGMIAHHEGAIEMAQDELDDGSDPAMRSLARSIISAQRVEIAEMQGLLAEQ